MGGCHGDPFICIFPTCTLTCSLPALLLFGTCPPSQYCLSISWFMFVNDRVHVEEENYPIFMCKCFCSKAAMLAFM